MMELVSMIIPVYGVEAYLGECLETVLNQTYENLEIILIDDESPDYCPEICDQHAQKDARIKVIHQKNGGAANARNHGLDMATGEYICFIDSDDKIENNYVEKLLNAIKKSQSDVAVCSFKQWYKNKTQDSIGFKNKEYSSKDYIRKFLSDWTCGLIWNKMFDKKTLEGVRFEEGHKIDDEFFTYQAILKAEKVVVFDESLYWYRMRKSGVMLSGTQYQAQMLKDRLEYMTNRYEMVIEKYPDLKAEYLYNLTDNLISYTRQAQGIKELEKDVRAIKKQYWNHIMFGLIPMKIKYSFFRSFFDKTKEELSVDEGENHYFE